MNALLFVGFEPCTSNVLEILRLESAIQDCQARFAESVWMLENSHDEHIRRRGAALVREITFLCAEHSVDRHLVLTQSGISYVQ